MSNDDATENPEPTNENDENDDLIESAELTDEDDESEEDTKLLIDKVIDGFIHRVLDIEDCANDFISITIDKYNENAQRLRDSISECQKVLEDETEEDKRLQNIKLLRQSIREIDRHNNSSPRATLEKSLFIYLFAAFDKYIGDLIAVLYQNKPDLYKNINREISLSEALQYDSIDELRHKILDKEIESIRRKGYIEQFKELEAKFSIKLCKFDSWPYFIERAQRRNLFTHCDGIVSKQYIEICKSVGVKFKEEPVEGDQLDLNSGYFFLSCRLLSEVAVMLGHTLWRKTQEDEREKADSHLSRLIFDFLHMEQWGKAISLGKFSLSLPNISTEEMERLFTVNYAIALKSIDKASAAKNILDKKDWSATTYDFKIAYAVLTENYIEAKDLMIKMGEKGELITEFAYHDWPLFREFRDKEEFNEAYLTVYGYKYSSKLSLLAEEKKSEVEHVDTDDEEKGSNN